MQADKSGMKRARQSSLSAPLPPQGAIEMTCHLYGEDPVQFHAYASFTARVDSYLSHHGRGSWAELNVRRFLARCASTDAEAGTMACMLVKLLPWMVCAGDITRSAARGKLAAVRAVCRKDAEVRHAVREAMRQLEETEASLLSQWLH